MNLQALLDTIPYVARHGARVLDAPNGEVRVRVPMGPEVANYVGTMHAGALFTAAETAAGAAAFALVPGGRANALLRDVRARYTRRAEGDVTATARIAPEAASAARSGFEEGGRADVPVAVTLLDPEGDIVLEGTFDYALRPVKP